MRRLSVEAVGVHMPATGAMQSEDFFRAQMVVLGALSRTNESPRDASNTKEIYNVNEATRPILRKQHR